MEKYKYERMVTMDDDTKIKWLSHKKMAENLYEDDKPRLISVTIFHKLQWLNSSCYVCFSSISFPNSLNKNEQDD